MYVFENTHNSLKYVTAAFFAAGFIALGLAAFFSPAGFFAAGLH